MKKLVLMMALIAGFAVSADAQERKQGRGIKDIDPEKMADAKTEKMSKLLDLSEEQKKEVHTLHLEQSKEWVAEMNERKEAGKKQKEQLEAILNEEQIAKLHEAKKDRNSFAERHFKGKSPRKEHTGPGKGRPSKPETQIENMKS